MSISKQFINQSFLKLKGYCEKNSFCGWDPFDGLNSRLYAILPFKNKRIFRLIWIQLLKRLIGNIRPLVLIKPDYNAKGLALFLSGYIELYKTQPCVQYEEKISELTRKIIACQVPGYSGTAWGYSFDWQSRAFFVPKNTPNVIVSTFVGNALLDVYDLFGEKRWLETSRSICNFILKDLRRSNYKQGFCFSYTSLDKSSIYNASLLASRFLARVYQYTKENHIKEAARQSVDFCLSRQREDGSWFYGEAANQRWIDSFHTGYNLYAIEGYRRFAQDQVYALELDKGFDYYCSKFFTSQGQAKYYNNKNYPFDTHSAATLIVVLIKTGRFVENRELIERVLIWLINQMQDKQGYFYYQQEKAYTVKIPYMRWVQAWMFYGLSLYLNEAVNHE